MFITVCCPYCKGTEAIVKYGKSAEGKQRFSCRSQKCKGRTFILDYSYQGRQLEVKKQVIQLAQEGNGVRSISRCLNISTTTVINELRQLRINF